MVNIDTLISNSNNTQSKQEIKSEPGSKQASEGGFATMFNSEINDLKESEESVLFHESDTENGKESSGNNLPNLPILEAIKLGLSNKKNQNEINIEEKVQPISSNPLFIDSESDVDGINFQSDDALLTQIQSSNKMDLSVSEKDEQLTFNNPKSHLEQVIDGSKPVIGAENQALVSSIKDSLISKEAIINQNNLISDNNDLEQLGELKSQTDTTLKTASQKNINGLELKQESKHLKISGEMDVDEVKAPYVTNEIVRSPNEKLNIQLDNSVANQLKQIIPELSTEQISHLKLSLKTGLAELELQQKTANVEIEIGKIKDLLTQVNDLIVKDKDHSSDSFKADMLVKTETIVNEIEKQRGLANQNDQSVNLIKNDNLGLTSQNNEQTFALGKAKQEVKESLSQSISDNTSLQSEEETLENTENELVKSPIKSTVNIESATVQNRAQIYSIFNDAIKQLEPQTVSPTEVPDTRAELTNSVTSQQISTSLANKAELEKLMQQPINIARSDAAKLLNERVTFMLNQHNPQADIRLDPPELGSMMIRVRTDAEQAQINFTVQSQQAKELLEESMPKLREMLSEQGIDLGESSIDQQAQGQSEQNSSNSGRSGATDNQVEDDVGLATVKVAGNKLGGVDFYA